MLWAQIILSHNDAMFFFYFPVSFCIFFWKMTKKKRKFPTLRYEVFIYARVIALLCERIICVIMRKNYLRYRSQHSLDIFHISREGAKRVFVFGVTLLFLHRNKKVTWTIRYKLIGGYYYMCFRLIGNKFTRQ